MYEIHKTFASSKIILAQATTRGREHKQVYVILVWARAHPLVDNFLFE